MSKGPWRAEEMMSGWQVLSGPDSSQRVVDHEDTVRVAPNTRNFTKSEAKAVCAALNGVRTSPSREPE